MKKLSLHLTLKFDRMTLLRWLPRITVVAAISILGYSCWYLYNNVLIGVSDTITLQSLSEQVLRVRLDVQEFEEVNEEFLQKIQGSDIDVTRLRNPFEDITPVESPETEAPPQEQSQQNGETEQPQ